MPSFIEDLMRQAADTTAYYMDRGRIQIAVEFDVEENSPEHIELCKALLPAYLAACTADFDTAIRHTGGN